MDQVLSHVTYSDDLPNPQHGPVTGGLVCSLTDKDAEVWKIKGLAQGQDPRVKIKTQI